MNRENMQRLIDFLEQLEDNKFNMYTFGDAYITPRNKPYSCGTAACIGGWATMLDACDKGLLFGDVLYHRSSDEKSVGAEAVAREFLELEYNEAFDLFYAMDNSNNLPCLVSYPLQSITREQAIQACKNMLEFGEPRWDTIMQEAAED